MRLVNLNTHFSVWKLAAKAKGGEGGVGISQESTMLY